MLSPSTGSASATPTDERPAERPYLRKRRINTRVSLALRAKIETYFQDHPGDRAEEMANCARDPVYWCQRWAWTYDPRNVDIRDPRTGEPLPTMVPLYPYPKQADYLRWLASLAANRSGGVCEKSRDEGVSWLSVGVYAVWALLFVPGWSGGIGSRKSALVDTLDDPGALIPKARIQIERLPRWMRPDYSAPMMRIVNRENGATLTGEGGDDIGRGARKSMYFVDEHAFLEHPEAVESALSQTSPCVVRVSTPNGEGNEFFRLRFSKRLPVFTLHWRDNPMKGPEWYEDECARLIDPVRIARELDIDYSASIEGVCIPAAWVRAAIEIDLGVFTARPVAGLDIADGGMAENVLYIRRGPVVIRGESWRGADVPGTALRAAAIAEPLGARTIIYDAIGVGAGIGGTLARRESSALFQGIAFIGGAAPVEMRHDDAPDLRASERFGNLRAQAYWILRERFAKTYRHVSGAGRYPLDELISIPNDPTLVMHLSQPRLKYTSAGKLLIESKEDMARRGVASPDRADALVYAFADPLVARSEAPIVISTPVY
jgi:phage terminase large subunit